MKKAVDTAGLRWPPEIPAVAYTRTARSSPFPIAAVGRPVLTELASQPPPKKANKKTPRNSAMMQQGGMGSAMASIESGF